MLMTPFARPSSSFFNDITVHKSNLFLTKKTSAVAGQR